MISGPGLDMPGRVSKKAGDRVGKKQASFFLVFDFGVCTCDAANGLLAVFS